MQRLLVVGLALAAVTCTSPINPDQGRFSCEGNGDCGDGWECISQFSGGGLCFKTGECVTELCNATDDNCDGRVDETFPSQGETCMTGQQGPCSVGRNSCINGAVLCTGAYTPVAETCNGIDDDCMNGVDDGFDFQSSDLHCGGCNVACPAGTRCSAAVCRESSCGDGVDNDADGGADCDDPACRSLDCGLDGGFNCGAVVLVPDGGLNDAGTPDAGGMDAGDPDAGMPDAGDPDAGNVDAGLDAGEPDAGAADAGVDAGFQDAGLPLLLMCVPREAPCANGLDDDLDGRADCADSDCEGRACDGGTCMMGSCR